MLVTSPQTLSLRRIYIPQAAPIIRYAMFFRRRKRVKGFHASKDLDNPDIKIVSATLDGKPVFWGVGLSGKSRRELAAKGGLSPEYVGGEGTYRSDKELEWIALVNPTNLPGFISKNMIDTMLAGTMSAVSGEMITASMRTIDINTDRQALGLMKAVEAYAHAVRNRTGRHDQ